MADAGSFIRKNLILWAVLLTFVAGCAGGASTVKQGSSEPLAKLNNIEVKETPGSTIVTISTDKPVSFTSVKINEPPKMVIDLAGADPASVREPIKVGRGGIGYINTSRVASSKRLVRLEIGMDAPLASKTTQDGGVINIIFEKKPVPAANIAIPSSPAEKIETADTAKEPEAKRLQAAENAVPKAERVIKESAPEVKTTNVKPVASPVAPAFPQARRVNDVTFSKDGEGFQVRIEGDGKIGKRDVFRLGGDRIVVDLPEMGASKEKLSLEVGGKCLKKVRLARHQQPLKVRVVLDLGCAVDYDVKDDGKALVVSVAPAGSGVKTAKAAPQAPAKVEPAKAAVAPVVTAKAEKPAAAAAKAEAMPSSSKPAAPINVYISKTNGKAVLSSSPIEDAEGMTKAGGDTKNYVETDTKIYTGGRISFDIQDAELHQVMTLLADVAGLNLIMDPADVKGKVTLKLDNVPWDQALDILLRIYNLDKVIEGNVLRVAAKAKLDDEKRRELLQVAEQKKLEQQAEDLYTKTFKVNYTTATDLEPKVKKILTPRGDSTANPRTNELIVTDTRGTLDKAEKLIRMLDKEVNQIMIEARIVTVDVGYSQSLGVSWGLRKNSGPNGNNPGFGVAQGDKSSLEVGSDGPNGSHSYTLNLPTELAAAAGGVVGAMTWGNLLKDINLDLTISALESINKAETLASPKVFTLENQAATITSGTTLYVQTTSASGTKPEPLNANLSLTVTPRVTGDNFIMMDVTATNNTPADPPPGSTAAINTQAVTTSVLVKNGDTVVLGGVYIKTKSNGDSHIPLLGRIPILKYLFSSNTWKDTTSELLIFITPKLVRQTNQV